MTETTAMVCRHVYNNQRKVELVVRHSDGGWQLVCGKHDHPSDCSDFALVGLEHLIARQANLVEIRNLGYGLMAERAADGWVITVQDD